MKTEFECRFTDIDLDETRQKLSAAGFVCIESEHMMRRKIFDVPNLSGVRRWLRLRDEGDKVTLTLKLKGDLSDISSMREVEVEVGNFDDMAQLLVNSDLEMKAYEENKREKWARGNDEACLDTWPGLDTFLEIESDSEDKVKNIVAELGLNYANAMFGNVIEVYEKKLGLDLADVQASCTFENPPCKK